MRYVDINKRYTEIVAEYIVKGYAINTSTMNGSQGETAKIDLTNGAEIIRVMINTFSDWRENIEGVEIVVGCVADKTVKPHDGSGRNTIWNNELDVISTERFYKIGDRNRETYYGTENQAKAAAALKLKRYIAKQNSRETENIADKAMDIAKRIIRREFGVKRICEADVKVTKCHGAYVVGYKSKTYRLH